MPPATNSCSACARQPRPGCPHPGLHAKQQLAHQRHRSPTARPPAARPAAIIRPRPAPSGTRCALRTKGHPHADFTGPLAHRVRDHAIESNHAQEQGHRRESADQPGRRAMQTRGSIAIFSSSSSAERRPFRDRSHGARRRAPAASPARFGRSAPGPQIPTPTAGKWGHTSRPGSSVELTLLDIVDYAYDEH